VTLQAEGQDKPKHAECSPCHLPENLTRASKPYRGYLTEKEVAIVARTLLQVVEYCHRQNVLHRGEEQVLAGSAHSSSVADQAMSTCCNTAACMMQT
jgi:hypothetical protein